MPGFSVVPDIGETEILKALRECEANHDIVVVDLPGGSSTLALKSMQRSHFVLVPMRPSLPDARDAMKTVAQVDDAEELARTPIPRALLWTLFRPGFESKVSRHVRTTLEGQGVSILQSALMERSAFQAIHLSGRVPRQTEPHGAAAANITALSNEVMEWLKSEDKAA